MSENRNHTASPQEETQSYIEERGGYDSPVLRKTYAVRITDAVKRTIHGTVHNDPVAIQYIPQKQELKIVREERGDPIGDYAHTPVKGLVHRYADRVLLKLANVCAVYCRYCFRREMVGPGADVLNAQERTEALDYIRNHKKIWEVILTGGDPLILSARNLCATLDELEEIEHVQIVRIHTRIPIADPARITPDLLKALKNCKKPVYVVLHINHVQEISNEARAAITALLDAGCVLLSQSVLLRGVNDNVEALENLFRTLVTLKIKPYYLHHPDMAPGTSHFRVSIREGQALMRKLQNRLSGLCMPSYMLDIPGGYGKVPIALNYLQELESSAYLVEDTKGINHHYPPQDTEQE
jgi:lysine 2,3-aminomutase